MDSMSSVSPAVPKAILQHLQVGIVVVFRPYEAKLISIICQLSWFPWKPGHMTIPMKFNKLKRGTFKLHLTKNCFKIS